jgi:hypothetical protein
MLAARLSVGGKTTGFDADEWTCVHWMYLLCGRKGSAEGKLLESRGKVSGDAIDEVDAFIARARSRFDEVLVLWEGGHGLGTIAWELHDAVELIDRLGLRYRRHVVGTDDEVFHKGRPVEMEPDRLGRIPPMVSAFDKLELVLQQARDRGLGVEITFRLPGDSF